MDGHIDLSSCRRCEAIVVGLEVAGITEDGNECQQLYIDSFYHCVVLGCGLGNDILSRGDGSLLTPVFYDIDAFGKV